MAARLGAVNGPPRRAGRAARRQAIAIIAQKRGPHYLWPGNFREVERTVCRIFLHDKDVHASPSTRRPAPATDTAASLGRDILAGRLTMDEIERRVVLAVYQKTRSQRRGAVLLGIDRERFAKRLREALGEGAGALRRWLLHADRVRQPPPVSEFMDLGPVAPSLV